MFFNNMYAGFGLAADWLQKKKAGDGNKAAIAFRRMQQIPKVNLPSGTQGQKPLWLSVSDLYFQISFSKVP